MHLCIAFVFVFVFLLCWYIDSFHIVFLICICVCICISIAQEERETQCQKNASAHCNPWKENRSFGNCWQPLHLLKAVTGEDSWFRFSKFTIQSVHVCICICISSFISIGVWICLMNVSWLDFPITIFPPMLVNPKLFHLSAKKIICKLIKDHNWHSKCSTSLPLLSVPQAPLAADPTCEILSEQGKEWGLCDVGAIEEMVKDL